MPLDALNWEAEIRPLYGLDGMAIPKEIVRGVYRNDTNEIIGTAGPNTKLIQHQDVLDPILQTLHDQKYEVLERDPGKRDLYDLKGHRGAFVSTQFSDSGAVMRAKIITGDFIAPTGPSSFLPDGPPTLFREFSPLNSHNSRYAAQNHLQLRNVECMNGMVSTEFAAIIKSKHTQGFNVEAFKRQVLAAADMMENDTHRMQQYIRSPLTRDQAIDFIKKTFAKLPDKPTGEPNHSERMLNDILERFNAQPSTVWGLYMALTEWATHGDLKRGAQEVTSRIGRDERVARCMRTPHFKELLVA